MPVSTVAVDDTDSTEPLEAEAVALAVAPAGVAATKSPDCDEKQCEARPQLSEEASEPKGEAPAPADTGEGNTGSICSDKECVICYDGVGDHVMLPCGHGGFCGKCAEGICTGCASSAVRAHACPVCRVPIDSVVKVSLGTDIGECSSAECALIVQHESNPSQPPSNAGAIHNAMMQFARVHTRSTAQGRHVVVYPARFTASNSSSTNSSSPGS
jgi:hypothetical protein